MRLVFGMIAIAALLSPSMAAAQGGGAAAAVPSEHRLSPEQVEAALTEAAAKNAAAEKKTPVENTVDKGAEQQAAPTWTAKSVSPSAPAAIARYSARGSIQWARIGVAAISFDFVDLGHRRFRR